MKKLRIADQRPRRNPESGYVLLLIFAMAAIVAISLYTQVPRVAFEAQRDKEQLLMDRGHEYVRAVTLFVHKFNRFPASMEELENTNNIRFLRKRYVDPMTGKADWRILHAGPGGVITDSITAKKPDAASDPVNITLLQMFGTQTPGSTEGVNLAARRRASDQTGGAGDPTGGSGPGNTAMPAGGAGGVGTAGSAYNGPVMVLPDGRIVPANTSGTAPAPPQPGAAPNPNSPLLPGVPGAPGASGAYGYAGAPLPSGVAIQQNAQNGQNTPGLPSQLGPPNSAANLINQILTTPRPGGLNGPGGASPQGTPLTVGSSLAGPAPAAGQQGQQQIVGGGIAGVASTREQEGIKTYNDRTKYNEWEFVYDITKDVLRAGNAAAAANAAQNPNGASGTPGQMPAPGQTTAPGQSGAGPAAPTTSGFGFPSAGPGGMTPGR